MPPKKKKRKPRSRARGAAVSPVAARPDQGPQSQEKRRERLEARREAKAKAAAQRYKQQQRARIVRIVVLLASLAAIVWFLFLRGSVPNAIAGHDLEHFDTFTSESNSNTLHTSDPITYDEVPPVSGQHSPLAADCGIYGEPLPNENMVHSLEHGAVGILYQPDLSVEEVRAVEAIVGDYDSHVFSAPYEGLEDPYTIVAWAHLMRLGSFDEDAVVEFIDFFREGGDAPEEQECVMRAAQPFEPTPTASPTSSASPAPEETGRAEESEEGSGDEKKEKKKG
jgi:hypothetical protein